LFGSLILALLSLDHPSSEFPARRPARIQARDSTSARQHDHLMLVYIVILIEVLAYLYVQEPAGRGISRFIPGSMILIHRFNVGEWSIGHTIDNNSLIQKY